MIGDHHSHSLVCQKSLDDVLHIFNVFIFKLLSSKLLEPIASRDNDLMALLGRC
jgi:hypothetical protein